MDIIAALEATERPSTGLRCVIGRFIDEIPDDNPGKAKLVAHLETADQDSPDWLPQDQLDKVLLRLGLQTSNKSIGDHRSGSRCRCYL